MNKREQEQFAAFFEQMYQTEELLDFIKLQLVQSNKYDPNLIFNLLSGNEERITLQQMRNYMFDKIACNERELYQIFERFDWTRQGSISRSDFLNELAPFGRQVQSINHSGGSLTAQIEGHFISLILEILKRFRIVEVIRKQLKYIQPYDAFEHIDYHKTGCIGIPELRKLFFENDFNVNDKQLYYLLHALRRRCYRDINLEVFCQNLDPLEFGFYVAYQNQLDEERAIEFANRSREEEEVMRRSRVQAQRIEHEFQKAERKKQAELQRQLQVEDKVNLEILNQQELKERKIRRALLEEDRSIRYDVATGGELYRQDLIRNEYERLENQHLNSIKLREQQVNNALASSALDREHELERSRRALQYEREYLHRQEIDKERSLIRSNLAAQQLQASRRRIEAESRRILEDESRRIQVESRRRNDLEISRRRAEEARYEEMLQASRRDIEESRKFRAEQDRKLEQLRRKAHNMSRNADLTGTRTEHQRTFDKLEQERERARQEIAQIRNNRIGQYEKELQKTRYDMYGQSRRTGDYSSAYK